MNYYSAAPREGGRGSENRAGGGGGGQGTGGGGGGDTEAWRRLDAARRDAAQRWYRRGARSRRRLGSSWGP